jgi:hypothetical protein
MSKKLADPVFFADFARYIPGRAKGHYESYFLRANHPKKPQAFWIRYTVFSPKGRPEDAIGEVWAVYFDGETGEHTAVKEEYPISSCAFNTAGLAVKAGRSLLDYQHLTGEAASKGQEISWNLEYSQGGEPVFLFPFKLYTAPFPKAKAVAGRPMAVFNGRITVGGKSVPVTSWTGSQNHNWGEKHTDDYAWGQVMGFDNAPESCLELATGRIKLGPVWTPCLNPVVLRHGGRQYALNALVQCVRAKGKFEYFSWTLESHGPEFSIKARLTAPASRFVCLTYYNPPGGAKHCLNSKLASCEVELAVKGKKPETLMTEHRAAFEILTGDRGHGIAVRV